MNTRRPALGAACIRGRAAVISGSISRRVWGGVLLMAVVSLAAGARAQTDAAHSEKVSLDDFKDDTTSFSTSIGAALNSGNTQSMQATVGTTFGMIRGRHALDLSMDFQYGRAALKPAESSTMVDTARNLRSRGRYAMFVSPMDAAFVAGAYRWDTFAGLDARLQGQLGYLRNLYKRSQMRIWSELGYDLTYENYDPDPLFDPDTNQRLKGYKYLHSARLFLGYDNQINPMAVVALSVEGLLNVREPGDSRVNGDLALRSVVVDRLQLELKFILQIDTKPAFSTLKKYDGILKFNLLYTLI